MAEYIEKKSLIDHLKKDPLFGLVERYGITGVIESIPAADVQPVVRCKDCVFYNRDRYCLNLNTFVEDSEWFCAYGERAE